MPTPEQVKTLADAGGYVLFVFTSIVGAVAFYKGWVIPGWLYREKSEDVKALNLTVTKLTDELRRERQRRGTDRAPR